MNMKSTPRWLRWTLGAAAVLALAVWLALQLLHPRHAAPRELSQEMKTQSALAGPAKVYAATCAHCHDTKIAAPLNGRGLSPEVVKVIVRNGKGAMPSFLPSSISEAQLAELATYVSGLPAGAKP